MLLGRPSIERANYICFKFQKVTYTSWVEMGCSLGLKSNGMLGCHPLNTAVTILNRRNSTEANDLNQSELFHLSAIVGFWFSLWADQHVYITFCHFHVCYVVIHYINLYINKKPSKQSLVPLSYHSLENFCLELFCC